MSIEEFNLLTFDQKCQVIFRRGIYLEGRNEENLVFNLYSIFSFYAELCYNLEDDYMASINVFKYSRLLEPYINEIKISI